MLLKSINRNKIDQLINRYYFSRFSKKNLKLSVSNKVSLIDHYIWWFSNKRKFQVYEFSNKKLIFFWYEKKKVFKNVFWTCGFHVDEGSNLNEIILSYRLFIRFLKKKENLPILGIISKKNIFLKKLNKDLGFNEILNKKNDYLSIKSVYKIKNEKKFIFVKL